MTHPNVNLLAHLKPAEHPRKTFLAILADECIPPDEDCPRVKVNGEDYFIEVLSGDDDETYALSASKGDILVRAHFLYGVGEVMPWHELTKRVGELETWCRKTCEKQNCSYTILIGIGTEF